MGRGLLIFTVSLVVVYSFYMMSMRGRQLNVTQQNASFVENVDDRNAALSAIQVTVGKLKKNTDWRNDYEPYHVSVPGSTIEVEIDDPSSDSSIPANEIRLTADVSAGDSEVEVIAMVSGSGLPAMDGALTLISDHIDFSASGNAFSIDGHDHNLWGARKWNSSTVKPGITVNSEDAESSLNDGLRHMQTDNIEGAGGEPSIEVDRDFDVEGLKTKVDSWAEQADITDNGGRHSNTVWGTRDNPQITVVNDDVELYGNTSGFGVLIVENGSKLKANGNFRFQGVILMRGDDPELEIRGNGKILGMTTMLGCTGASGGNNQQVSAGNIDDDHDGNGDSDDEADDKRERGRWRHGRAVHGGTYANLRQVNSAGMLGSFVIAELGNKLNELIFERPEYFRVETVINPSHVSNMSYGKDRDDDDEDDKDKGPWWKNEDEDDRNHGQSGKPWWAGDDDDERSDDDEDEGREDDRQGDDDNEERNDDHSRGGSSGDCDLKIDLRGNVDIKYSSKALSIIKDKMGGKMGIDFEILRIYE